MDVRNTPILYWFRRDLRLSDHAGLFAASATGRAVIPVFICDPLTEGQGAASRLRLDLAIKHFESTLRSHGSRLILRRGPALQQLEQLVAETGAGSVWWTRAYSPDDIARDKAVKSALHGQDVEARSFAGHLLVEPWEVSTGSGNPYRVFTPYWRAVRRLDIPAPVPGPMPLVSPVSWPASDQRSDWHLDRAMHRGGAVVRAQVSAGEAAALQKLDRFLSERSDSYTRYRDIPGAAATSDLSDHLALGEIGPRTVWHAGRDALVRGDSGAETFLKQLIWREFSYHLMFHTPGILTDNWRPGWDSFPWDTDPGNPGFVAWKQGRTGLPFVDAAMREMYVTGRMHNRARMIAASFLTKHLLMHWKLGMNWFANCLTDWDPACNAMGWQWVAGSGPDAAPYFRIFNPETQRRKFDPEGSYISRWIAEGQPEPPQDALSYFDAIPAKWRLTAGDEYPEPVVSLAAGRERALTAYKNAKI